MKKSELLAELTTMNNAILDLDFPAIAGRKHFLSRSYKISDFLFAHGEDEGLNGFLYRECFSLYTELLKRAAPIMARRGGA